ncbi:hypothetical protein QO012_002640 [Methylobacterium aerolatum]|uniref:Uncharacterized protein n=1 Tax=Methylobacterium aerolatum TaxID=418708 RepID=A0ABU0I0K8_9HYPH|nr:hypothetical protein [Methylobacterium aerolatum]GJD34000.1 hypothetical protein FMGBMHLM_0896 [Methylobacterium aerolatum]
MVLLPRGGLPEVGGSFPSPLAPGYVMRGP